MRHIKPNRIGRHCHKRGGSSRGGGGGGGGAAADSPEVKAAQADVDKLQQSVDATEKKLEQKLKAKSLNPIDDYNQIQALREKLVSDRNKLSSAEKALAAAKKDAGVKEVFTQGKPLSDKEMNRPLSNAEMKLLGDKLTLKDPRTAFTDNGRDAAKARIKEYQSAQKLAPGLTQSEFLAIQGYTKGNGYIGPNAAAKGWHEDANSAIARQHRIEARLIHQAVQKAPIFKGELRRDTQISATQFKKDYKVGAVIQLHGLTSTTKDLTGRNTAQYGTQKKADPTRGQLKESNKAGGYATAAKAMGIRSLPSTDATQVEFRIKAKSGRNISSLSRASSESEVALPHGWRGKIEKIESYKNSSGQPVQRVYMEEI